MQYLLVLFVIISPIIACKTITVFSDFTKDADVKFFKTTFPWLIDNVGTDIRVKYHFLDSGVTSGPRICTLDELKSNIYLQARYLKCEAEGKTNEECKKRFPINSRIFDRCLKLRVNSFVKTAIREFNKVNGEKTPLVVLPGRKEIKELDSKILLNGICDLFGRRKPRGCLNPTVLDDGKNEKNNGLPSAGESSQSPSNANNSGDSASTDESAKQSPSGTGTENQNTGTAEVSPDTKKSETADAESGGGGGKK